MKSSKKGFNAHGNEHKTHKPSKHDANLRKNGTLHFQIGLLISCTLVFLAFQINFKVPEYDIANNKNDIEDEIFTTETPVFKRYVDPKQEKIEPTNTKKVKIIDEIVIIDDEDLEGAKESVVEPNEPSGDPNIGANVKFVGPVDDELDPVPFILVEEVPIFPGCESLTTNAEQKKCMSEKIDRIVRRNFRTNKAVDYGLKGKQKIYVQFKINKQGLVSDIQVRAPHRVLEDEARRVTELIPQMKPGRQRSKDVEVVFLKPIIFQVQ